MREERTMTKHTNIWWIGKVTITRIVEFEVSGQSPSLILANVEPEHVKRFDWLRPHYADDDGQLAFSVHACVIESEGRRIIVDTCAQSASFRSTGRAVPRLRALSLPARPSSSTAALLSPATERDRDPEQHRSISTETVSKLGVQCRTMLRAARRFLQPVVKNSQAVV